MKIRLIISWCCVIASVVIAYIALALLADWMLTQDRDNWGNPYSCSVKNETEQTYVVHNTVVTTVDIVCPEQPELSRKGFTVSYEVSKQDTILIWVNHEHDKLFIADGIKNSPEEKPWEYAHVILIPMFVILRLVLAAIAGISSMGTNQEPPLTTAKYPAVNWRSILFVKINRV